ncbi:unnamed protein product [Rhizoctonia solani]|uniref:Protein kinase domain-containing protein n=1 Tax=Rhizoctonia solani TaxID=456999 RepID=A0A8H3B515_9AGAM|nr:unnamed protein product [Rhizoctonia solani]
MTLRWTAPEIFLGETQHTYEGDVYALGMTILETMTGSIPWDNLLDVTVMHNLMQKIHPSRPERWIPTGYKPGDRLWELMVRCWANVPGHRPHAMEVCDELDNICKRHQLASSTNVCQQQTSVGAQTATELSPSISLTPRSPLLAQETRRFWKRSWGINGQTTDRNLPNTATSMKERFDEKKQRKLELLEKRKLQEERARAIAKGVMAKRELLLVNENFMPGDWTDPLKICHRGRIGRILRYSDPTYSYRPSGWPGPDIQGESTNDRFIVSPDQRSLSGVSVATVASDPGPTRRQYAPFEQFVSEFETEAGLDEGSNS